MATHQQQLASAVAVWYQYRICEVELSGDGAILRSSGSSIMRNNTVEDAFDDGLRATPSGSPVTVANNTVTDASDTGINVETNDELTVSDNTVTDSENGILIEERFGTGVPDGTVTNNELSGNDVGLLVEDDASLLMVSENNIDGNDPGLVNEAADELNATLNWWGSDTGPSGEGPGTGDSVSENVEFDPWLDAPFDDGPGGITDDGFSVENFDGADEAERESDEVTASADVTNEIEEFGLEDEDGETVTVRYLVDGDEADSREMSIVAGETETVVFEDISVPESTTAAAPDAPQVTDHEIEVVGSEGSASDGGTIDLTNPIQQAVDTAGEDGTATALAGTYEENVEVLHDGLTLTAEDDEDVTLEADDGGEAALELAADDVRVSNFEVADGNDDGVLVSDGERITVEETNVTDFSTGLSVVPNGEVMDLTVNASRFEDNHNGLGFEGSPDTMTASVTNSTIASTSSIGMQASGEVLVSESTIVDSGVFGIWAVSDAEMSVSESTVANSDDDGIWAVSDAEMSVSESAIVDSGGAGIRAANEAEMSVSESTIADSGNGIWVTGEAEMSVSASTIADSDSHGILTNSGMEVSVSKSTIEDNGANGIVASIEAEVSVSESTIENNGDVASLLLESTGIRATGGQRCR